MVTWTIVCYYKNSHIIYKKFNYAEYLKYHLLWRNSKIFGNIDILKFIKKTLEICMLLEKAKVWEIWNEFYQVYKQLNNLRIVLFLKVKLRIWRKPKILICSFYWNVADDVIALWDMLLYIHVFRFIK